MNSAANYRLASSFIGLLHGWGRGGVVHDDVNTPAEVQALVASGDAFATLATKIDEASSQLSSDAPLVQPHLESVARTLLYLQRHYEIRRKPSDYRQ